MPLLNPGDRVNGSQGLKLFSRPSSRWRAAFGQLRHHRAFRIGPSEPDAPVPEDLRRLIAELTAGPAKTSAEPEQPLGERDLARAVTDLWRAQRKLDQLAEAAPRQAKQSGRYLANCRTALEDAGLEIQQHDGQHYHDGLALNVIEFVHDPSVERATVVHTIRPSIYLRGRHLQRADVIVGQPDQPDTAALAATTPGDDHA
jgi:hypothetical protein